MYATKIGPADERTEYRLQIERIRSEVIALTSDLSDEQFTWRPAPGQWSISECISHLNLFGQQVEETITALMEEAQARRLLSEGPYRHGLLGNWLIRLIEPPYRMRVRAVRRLLPDRAEPKEQVVPAFLQLQDRLEALLHQSQGLDLGAVRRSVPPAHVPLTLGQWFAIGLAHERRHLWQAAQIRARPGFPAP